MSSPHDIARVNTSPADAAGADRPSAPGQSPEQLKLLAAQFEALLMGQMLRQMQSSMFDDDEGGSGFAKGPLGDALYSELGLSLGRSGGMGLGDSLLAPLLRQASQLTSTSLDMTKIDGSAEAIGLESAPLTLSMLPVAIPAATAAPSAFSLGPVSSAFGWRSDPLSGAQKFHKGTDIAMPSGQEVPVASTGRVSFAGQQSGYGLTVLVDHGNGISTRYGHLSELSVSVGDQVKEGQTVGKSGASGRATGPHLHFEVIENGQPVDPRSAMTRLGTSVHVTD